MPIKEIEKHVLRGKFQRNQFTEGRNGLWNLSRDCSEVFGNDLFFVATYEMTGLSASKVEKSTKILELCRRFSQKLNFFHLQKWIPS
jgi:hypothetical protein